MNREKMKTILHISFTEFGRWLRSSRAIILGVMLVFVHTLIVTTLEECASMMGEPVSIPEVFVALGNSGQIVLVIPALFLVLMADFPQKAGIDFLYQIRCSKKVWVCGQILFAVEAILFLVTFLAVTSGLMILHCGRWSLEFSHAVTHFAVVFPERSAGYLVHILPENVYHHMTLGTAVMHTALLMILYYLLLALILLLSALCNKKYAGILADAFLVIMGTITCAGNMKVMWLFPMAHTISWLHYEEYLRKEIFPMKGSYAYLLGGCLILLICCIGVSRKYQAGKV